MPHLLVFALLLGLAPAFIASGKNRSFVLWWAYGVVLGPFALVHALMLRNGDDAKAAITSEPQSEPVQIAPLSFKIATVFALAVTVVLIYQLGTVTDQGSGQRQMATNFPERSVAADSQAAASADSENADNRQETNRQDAAEKPAAAQSAEPAQESTALREIRESAERAASLRSKEGADKAMEGPDTASADVASATEADTARKDAGPDTDAEPRPTEGQESTASEVTAVGDLVQAVQQALVNKGYDPGSVNGRADSRTASAIRKFQGDRGLRQTGAIDHALLEALGIVGPRIFAFKPPHGTGIGR